jgi:hypothetical protein
MLQKRGIEGPDLARSCHSHSPKWIVQFISQTQTKAVYEEKHGIEFNPGHFPVEVDLGELCDLDLTGS